MSLVVPAKIVECDGDNAVFDISGMRRRGNVSLVSDPQIGETVLVHAGFAIQKWSEKDRREYDAITQGAVESASVKDDRQAGGDMERIHSLAKRIGRDVRLMEISGIHTMAAFRAGLRPLLPDNVSLLSGPGCPVCVTPADFIDGGIAISQKVHTCVATPGDMIRAPGTELSLERAKGHGGRVQVVYSPLDALDAAVSHEKERLVYLGIGFEATAAAVAWTIKEARKKKIKNYSVLCGHKQIPPALSAILQQGDVSIDGFMCPGHVSVIIGSQAYAPICRDFRVPCVVAGFERADMIAAIEMLLTQILEKRADAEIQYKRSVKENGNPVAQALVEEVFEPCDDHWLGLGMVPNSGFKIREAFAEQDASYVFGSVAIPGFEKDRDCICGEILRGARVPTDCPLFRKQCRPETPVQACMVSSEGPCAAYFRHAARS